MKDDNVLIPVAMQIIIFAGNARTKTNQALDYLKTKDFSKAKEYITEARQEIINAHKEQTDIIQKEAAGESYETCLLFTHAQDTLMTIMSEVNLAEKMIELFEIFMVR
ncbi:PTS lactose/cellobiose transporter subunit IIA [Anaerocolumna sp. MB42-C2]|uniref:PTS lactose/cellobiose transporter subunit IIA n=1 Tax=Anaerocolumna sp. MB42-C2 TaxID=3070997 RepID=UPI0027DFE209|nr:PTS lactose/cellobiose transporter subunit IIA [Anaerocolumna sp. MB42-C2]WMJ89233.1 PTS lactose/cellobiose transporter subunit IIA [Anaerocolumna sp. MB42-C2]